MTQTWLIVLFWLGIFVVFYAYIGYGILLYLLVRIKRAFSIRTGAARLPKEANPSVTVIVAAYNEENWIAEKIENSLALDYPRDKTHFLFVTDGSSDNTPKIIQKYVDKYNGLISLHHQPERRGKIAAVERIMPFVKTPITVYTDANTMLNAGTLRNMTRHYANPKVGAVAGEKRISMGEREGASGAGEGIYWKYESALKRWDSELYSVVGAAGELFSIRTELYEPVALDMIIEDFYMTMRIAQKGYQVRYEPDAYAVETGSASVKEELKRKIRIAAGAWQAVWRLAPVLNIFKYGVLSFQYISHRVLRWTLAPLFLPVILLANILLVAQGTSWFYKAALLAQILFYGMAFVGYLMEQRQLKFKAFFVPYYFCMMNYAMYRGFGRIVSGNQSVMWEKAKRA